MNPKEHLPLHAELDDDALDGVTGGLQNPAPLRAPVQPAPSIPSIPPDPGLAAAIPSPTPTPTPAPSPCDAGALRDRMK